MDEHSHQVDGQRVVVVLLEEGKISLDPFAKNEAVAKRENHLGGPVHQKVLPTICRSSSLLA